MSRDLPAGCTQADIDVHMGVTEHETDSDFVKQATDEVCYLLDWTRYPDMSSDEVQTQLENLGTIFSCELMFDIVAAEDKFRGCLSPAQIKKLESEAEQYVQDRSRQLESDFWFR